MVPSGLDPFRLAILPIDPDRHCSVLTFRLVILLINSDRHCSVQTFRLVILLIDSNQHCSVQALACTRNLQIQIGLLLVLFSFYFICEQVLFVYILQ